MYENGKKVYLNLSIFFTVFLKNRNFISKIRISKVTDYAVLTGVGILYVEPEQNLISPESSVLAYTRHEC